MRLTKIQRHGLTMLAQDEAYMVRSLCMNDRWPIKIKTGNEELKVAQVTFRSWLNHGFIYKVDEVQGKSLRAHRIMTYEITDTGRKVVDG